MIGLLAACTSGDGPADRSPDAPEHSAAGPEHSAVPTTPSLAVACEPTDNALRFACTVDVSPPQRVTLRWRRTDGAGVERTRASADAAGHHEVPVWFLAPELGFDVVAEADDGRTAATTLTAGTPPTEVGSWLEIGSGASSSSLVGTANACARDAHAVVYDTVTGDLAWYQDLDPEGVLGVLDMIRFTAGTAGGDTHHRVVEVDRSGVDLARFDAVYPGQWGLHHDLFVDGDRYLAPFQDERDGRILDPIVVLDRAGVERHRWDPREHLVVPAEVTGDWLHTNTVVVAPDGDLYLSWKNRNAIARIASDGAGGFGEVRWILVGDDVDGQLPNDFTLDWSRVGGEDRFGAQHHLVVRADGKLQFLDNPRGRVLIVSVDEGLGTATVEGSYPTREASCGAQGTASETAAGTVLAACFGPWLAEYDPVADARTWEARLVCRDGSQADAVRWYPLDEWE